MAGIKEPIQDILTRMATLQVLNQDKQTVALLARIWNNQFKKQEDGQIQAFPLPAGFLEVLNPASFKRIGVGFDAADVIWRFHIGHWFNDAMDGTFEQDLAIFDLRDKLITLFSNFKPTGCSSMMHVADNQNYEHKNVYVYQIDFISHFIDSKGSDYDSDATKYIDSAPPTTLQLNKSVGAGAETGERKFIISHPLR